ncbi:PKD domain-containing protein [Candidatus Bathyarchaeota archaeon]|nr:MAG: PKD domain-containing protein [Candidatus Bathyarchaeota archaeon]
MCERLKEKLKLSCLLIVITVSALAFADRLFIFTASATYIEGDITQDTVWTLTDSPFTVSKNITVYPTATLTIEPGVQVRFGGDFSLNVRGSLSAIGEENNTITFTSNKDQPKAGDWNTIKFNGTEPSTLTYCSIQYAKNAITIENSNVKIENCEITNNSQNGITIENSIAEVKYNEIANNLESGVYITGNNQVTIQNNTISSNKNGILLTGSSTTGVSITENIVMSNTQSGIQLDANAYSGLVIVNNILSANNKGFYITGQANTYITRNSISYNTIGIFYKGGKDHVAYYNDIYGNEYGMNVGVSFNATISAEYNYWGHESGPYHISLNPTGKGNPVGGNGVNLDFIFFLTAPIGYINTPPTAKLLTDKTLVPPNQIVTFIATNSSDDRRVDKYLFDFGDGGNSDWTTLSIFVHKYSSLGTYNATVTVMDDFGRESNNTAVITIRVQNLTSLDVSITPSAYTVGHIQQVPITIHITNGTNPVENAHITLFSVHKRRLDHALNMHASFLPSSGFTNSTGYFVTMLSPPNVTQITNIRITATASKNGYADGSDHEYLAVLPPLLVQVTADPSLIESEATSQVTAHVTYNGQPVANALVTISSDSNGNFSAETGITDSNGNITVVFTAPQAFTQLNVMITATATKTGYADGEDQVEITVNPGTLNVQITANPVAVESRTSSTITVGVTYNANPVADAEVTILSDGGGDFSVTSQVTDSNGNAAFTFTAPQTTTQLNVNIKATATKSGYTDGESQREITITPEAAPGDGGVGGLPLTTLLLIVVPIIVVAIVAVMIKLKIIYLAPE